MYKGRWFKFYGQDWLTDPKVLGLTPIDRLCFITLLCLASSSDYEDNRITGLTDEGLLSLTHIIPSAKNIAEWEKYLGVLGRLNDNEMITRKSNGDVIVTNFLKRQGGSMSGYERLKKYREKKKMEAKNTVTKPKNNDDNEMITENDTEMITTDKIRVDKIRVDTSVCATPTPQKIIDDIDGTKLDQEIDPYRGKYAPAMIEKFKRHWLQGTTYKKQPVRLYQELRLRPKSAFETGRRLATWAGRDEDMQRQTEARRALKFVEERPVHRERSEEREDTGFTKLFD